MSEKELIEICENALIKLDENAKKRVLKYLFYRFELDEYIVNGKGSYSEAKVIQDMKGCKGV